LVFSFTGEKIVIATPAIAVLLLVSLRRSGGGSRRPWFAVLLLGFLAAPMMITRLWPQLPLDVLVTRRLGWVPGWLTGKYVEYAGAEGFTWFSQSWLKWFDPGEESLSMGYRVGYWIWANRETNANANLWADGYASAGFLGVALTAALLAVSLRILDRIAESRDPVIAGALLGTVCMTFVNGYFHTALLTGGVIFGGLLMWALPVEESATKATGGRPGAQRAVLRSTTPLLNRPGLTRT
jgi:hypothetical protein